MWKIAHGDPQGLVDCDDFLAFLNGLGEDPRPEVRDLLSAREEVFAARAPGRLDVMGGIADYSGALVLQLPLSLATWCAVQRRSDRVFRIYSVSPDQERYAEVDWGASEPPQHPWCAYVLGILSVWKQRLGFDPPWGLDIAVRSDVFEGGGISSSAALEVSAAWALARAYGIDADPIDLALDCQRVENDIVGAACGPMDQVTAACGRTGHLLQLLCQPAEVQGYTEVPRGLGFWGIDSGVRHSVAGTAYESVRVGAFMGHRILADAEGQKCEKDGSRVRIPDDPWRGYLANISLEQITRFIGLLPEEMRGRKFLQRYGGTIDTATRVDPDSTYPVRAATLHPIHEQRRIQSFASVLGEAKPDPTTLGRLMYESHKSYGTCGLGSLETDRIVELASNAGAESGIHGAKITGGGSGGTVVVLAARGAGDAVRDIASDYAQEQGRKPRIYSGSSPGAAALGCLQLRSTPA